MDQAGRRRIRNRDSESEVSEVRSEHTGFNGDHRLRCQHPRAARIILRRSWWSLEHRLLRSRRPVPLSRSGAPAHHGGDLALADMEYMVPSGYMGDATTENNGAAILDTGFNQGCRQGSPSCIKIEYKPADGKVGWAAFAWQRVIDGSDNWGQSPGADFSGGGFHSLRVYAKGIPDAAGLFPKVQFKSGGNVAPKYSTNRASYAVAGLTVQLTGQFQDYCLSLKGRDLSNTVSPFTAVVAKAGNAQTIVIILDDVRFSTESCN